MSDPTPTLPAKRPYVTPALVVHGDVQTITLGVGAQPQGNSNLSDPQG